MNSLGKAVGENGRMTNDRVVILDAGAQYGKVVSVMLIVKTFCDVMLELHFR